MTYHPKDRAGLTRRALLERAAALGLLGAGGGALAACANSTEANLGSSSAPSVVTVTVQAGGSTTSGPTPILGPGGIPLPRRDQPVTLPLYDDNPLIASGLEPEKGPLKLFNYSDYIDPAIVKKFEKRYGVKVSVSTFQSMDEAIGKLTAGKLAFDVFFPTVDRLTSLVARKLVRPLNKDYIPNLAANVWPELNDPFYDKGAQYTVPYTVYTTGIAWRNDKVELDPSAFPNPWDALWEVQGAKGKLAMIDDARDAIGMALRKLGFDDPNTEDPGQLEEATAALQDLTKSQGAKIAYSIYQDVPEGKLHLSEAWSGDILAGALYYMPKGVKSSALSYWQQPTGGPVANDTLTVLASGKNPVLAHLFLDFMLDERNAYDNFANFNGYQPPQNALDFSTLKDKLGLPDSLANVVVGREQWASGASYLPLTPTGESLWQKAWATVKAG